MTNAAHVSVSPAPSAQVSTSRAERATKWIVGLHDDTTALFTTLDEGGSFAEDHWNREGGGGGVSRTLTEGVTFEKVGVNRSAVFGTLSRDAALRLGGNVNADAENAFFATGVSIVAHPRNPRVPTVHLNVRYFEITDADGNVQDAWFGGGTDLTPTYPEPQNAHFFHRVLRDTCNAHHESFYTRFKPWCDVYFRNTHRGGEARGVGGIFFDHVRPLQDEGGLDDDGLFAFASDIAHSLGTAYAPIVNRERHAATNEAERALQLTRRGRYVEFNLLHDRGTLFGLQTGARVESVLMSLPPLARWAYAPSGSEDALSEQLTAMLAPRDWASNGE